MLFRVGSDTSESGRECLLKTSGVPKQAAAPRPSAVYYLLCCFSSTNRTGPNMFTEPKCLRILGQGRMVKWNWLGWWPRTYEQQT